MTGSLGFPSLRVGWTTTKRRRIIRDLASPSRDRLWKTPGGSQPASTVRGSAQACRQYRKTLLSALAFLTDPPRRAHKTWEPAPRANAAV